MTDLPIVKYSPCEWSYTCPFCGNEQGWTDYPDGEIEETFCNKCRKDFKVSK
jgi:hypothetical protein